MHIMSLPYSRAPHAKGTPGLQSEAPNAALLIDFDNVTMGMRSDLSKELKNLLNSDIIKGKVTVQRAYADWRRYPQYIVPLSENSVDLIFAPAYGSSKKNATDIRMAIDGMELVFIRPEIGTFILLTGDSDFSSLVLKLKEYGKYVIGVGIQESSSDILVQNCDEYYSYTSLTGLRKTTDSANKPVDPWVLVEQAVRRMAARSDVMRSDRLKQVMMEVDPSFDEGNFGFSKFSRFLSEAASRGLVELKKLDNGQYEIRPGGGGKEDGAKDRVVGPRKGEAKDRSREREKDKDREERGAHAREKDRGRQESRVGGKVPEDAPAPTVEAPEEAEGGTFAASEDPLQAAYGLLKRALGALAEGDGGGPVRDSDLKRKMLEMEPGFDEGELGFGKFSRFLRQAHDHEVVDLEKREEGTYQVSVRRLAAGKVEALSEKLPDGEALVGTPEASLAQSPASGALSSEPGADEALPAGAGPRAPATKGKGLGPRRGERRGRKGKEGPPLLLAGQVVDAHGAPARAAAPSGEPLPGAEPTGVDPSELGLPTDPSAIISYLTNSYKGVGKKTAENLVEAFGPDLFSVLKDEPERIEPIVTGRRAEQLLEGWEADLDRRSRRASQRESTGGDGVEEDGGEKGTSVTEGEASARTRALGRRRTRRGGRSRRG